VWTLRVFSWFGSFQFKRGGYGSHDAWVFDRHASSVVVPLALGQTAGGMSGVDDASSVVQVVLEIQGVKFRGPTLRVSTMPLLLSVALSLLRRAFSDKAGWFSSFPRRAAVAMVRDF
jgi:hypothetical protein